MCEYSFELNQVLKSRVREICTHGSVRGSLLINFRVRR